MAPNDTSPETYAAKLKTWLLYSAAVLAVGVVSAAVQRYLGPLPQPLPAPPAPAPAVVVVTPDVPGAAPLKVSVVHPSQERSP